MERRRFGRTDMDVSVLGFGGAEIGFEGASGRTVEELLNSALDAGLNVIDTAECYVNSEELIGNAVAGRRHEFYLFSKCGHGDTYTDNAWRAADIEKSIDRSLRRLKTDHLDLVQLHSCSEETLRRGEVMEALDKAKKAGKTRYVGYSGDGAAASYAIESGFFDALQTSVSIADQESIDLILPKAISAGLGVIAKRPVANAVWKEPALPANEYVQTYWKRMQALKYEFVNGNLADSIAIALKFTLATPGVHTAIVGTSKPGRWLENARMLAEGPLDSALYEKIRQRWQEVAQSDWVGQI